MQAAIYPDVPDDFGHWLAGLIDGEGCFLILRDTRQRRRDYFVAHFRLIMRSDDGPLLEECQRRTGLGRLYYREPWGDNPNRKPQARWETFTRSETQRLVTLLERYPLRSKKRRDFAIWAEAVRLLSRVQQYGSMHGRHDHIWDQVAVLYRQIIEVRKWRPHDSVLVPEPIELDAIPTGRDDRLALWSDDVP